MKLKMFALDNEDVTAGLLRPDGPGQARGAESLISARGARRESRLRASARLGQPWFSESFWRLSCCRPGHCQASESLGRHAAGGRLARGGGGHRPAAAFTCLARAGRASFSSLHRARRRPGCISLRLAKARPLPLARLFSPHQGCHPFSAGSAEAPRRSRRESPNILPSR